jgi:hypothetical protein
LGPFGIVILADPSSEATIYPNKHGACEDIFYLDKFGACENNMTTLVGCGFRSLCGIRYPAKSKKKL